jgi:hypothetical protein
MSPALAGRMGGESPIPKCNLFHAPDNKSLQILFIFQIAGFGKRGA